ncbi:helicase-related protein [Streptomyces mirabilis]|uniref:helicase-related protein n=1 Tax=Streptomyces mirabilis TaxID=68239 RepID=UPI0021BF0EC3|nr:helicase-related protein [Streptomyces mirabilis]MCT9105328.1 SNF2-related protein [Streptomyces mirabilis]
MTSDMTAATAPSPISLMPHQQQIHDFLVDHPFAGAWLGVGAGKTLTTLGVLQTIRPMGHILVIAPVAIARSTWIDEIEKWGFPIRTKSLIVDENDRKLSKDKRLQRFQEVFTDPPTMYFINQELLTQPPQREKLITPAAAGPAGSPEAAEVLDLVRARRPLGRDELIDEYRALVAGNANNRVPAKAKVRAWIQELLKSTLVTWEAYDCRTCSGAGCAQCRFGLIDQLPVQNINGQNTIIWPFQTVIIDESQGFKAHDSQRFLALAMVRPAMTRLIELTGTPAPNALTLDSPILTPTGWKPMAEVQIGDFVVGADGQPTEVVGVWPQGDKPIFRITFSDGTFVDCTEDHLWAVNSRSRRGKELDPLVIPTRELTKARSRSRATDLEIGLMDKNGAPRWTIPTVSSVRMPSQNVPLDPYLLGVLLGDGNTSHCPSFTTMDDEIRQYVEDALPSGTRLSRKTPRKDSKADAYYITTGKRGGSMPGPRRGQAPNPVKKALRELGLYGRRSWEKFIPESYMWNDESVRLELLRGLCDTDGASKTGRGSTSQFSTSSPQLAADVQHIIWSLGGYVTQRFEHREGPQKMPAGYFSMMRRHYVLSFGLPVNPFRLTRKARNWEKRWRVRERAICSIEPVGTAPAQCITVAAEEGLFLTKDFVVTHNSLHDLWSQVYLLDQGQTLGQNITAFRNRWFTPKMVPGTTTPAKWIPTANAEAEIHQAISHLVMSAQNTSLQIPALSIQDVNVTLPPDLLRAYKDFKRDLVLDIVQTYTDDDGKLTQSVESIVAANQAVLTSKLMQFASGTLYTADPDDPATKGRYEVIHDKKIEMTEYLVRNNGGEPVLIAYHFKSDKEQLLTRLRKAGIDAQAFDGSRDMVRRWNAKQIPVMLLHPAAAGHGLNLQHGGSTMIWYTLPFSLEHYLQTNGRLFRTGQTKPVTIHRLIAKGTQDERMPTVLAGKQQVQDDLIQAVSGDFNAEQALLAALEEEIREDLNDLWASERV